ncbi:MAG: isochorismate synthase [Flavobacterium sp.]|uniref:isochorismate synthase n=1 Tax=Flavobacterium frigidarium TaxID=99286 RepID=UPI0030DA4480|nr:isochorismate synthase [Flavobacterium sp.]|tara:strand:+ start:5015 stop:6097 length:1083 start_codon:yes stop_codon:yes gene_type:complete
MIDFFIKVKQQEAQNLPFVIYRKPNKNKLIGYFQQNDHLYFSENLEESGFVFAPFDNNQKLLIPKDQAVKLESKMSVVKFDTIATEAIPRDESSKAAFEAIVKKAVETIANGTISKVVLSRKEVIELPEFELVSVFTKLVQTYPTAFCYCWYHPKIGMWMGATPEHLLNAKKKSFYTMALAGTQKFVDTVDVNWGRKEMEEQQFVTDFIIDNLKDITTEVSVSSPYTLQAGSLLHIKTDIEGILDHESNLEQVVAVLHPTPAVCGFPKAVAKDFILENENYHREYYTGFLGELNKKSSGNGKLQSDLYVNLRCMKIENNNTSEITKASLYMGCGITKDSVPEDEWKESENKSITMKKIVL